MNDIGSSKISNVAQNHTLVSLSIKTDALKGRLVNLFSQNSIHTDVIWSGTGGNIIVDLSALQLTLSAGLIMCGLQMRCDQFEGKLLIPLHVGASVQDCPLIAVSSGIPPGQSDLAQAWGRTAQEIIWQSILRVMTDYWNVSKGNSEYSLLGLYAQKHALTGLFGIKIPTKEALQVVDRLKTQNFIFKPAVDNLNTLLVREKKWKDEPLIPRAIEKTARRITAIRFQDDIVLAVGEIIDLMKAGTIKVEGLSIVHTRSGIEYLRSKPDDTLDNNLGSLPQFSRNA